MTPKEELELIALIGQNIKKSVENDKAMLEVIRILTQKVIALETDIEMLKSLILK